MDILCKIIKNYYASRVRKRSCTSGFDFKNSLKVCEVGSMFIQAQFKNPKSVEMLVCSFICLVLQAKASKSNDAKKKQMTVK